MELVGWFLAAIVLAAWCFRELRWERRSSADRRAIIHWQNRYEAARDREETAREETMVVQTTALHLLERVRQLSGSVHS